ncbi:MAG: 2-amino-4-hydroxy-6-hydroxymethyldihydropteridine diphosphokinase [Lachnospiraceae bacterium]|nr:2-amino-4-hydroxy-6-hydroxymethyldihydropteridine diphosphokinase [Lachnospiraceae bacterium]
MGFITITGLKIFAHHGVLEEEKRNGQDFYVNAKLYYDMEKATKTDEVTDAVHYGEVCQFMTGFLQENTYKLLERAVAETMKAVLIAFPMLEGIDMELCKPHAPIPLPFENVSVTGSLRWHKAYLAIGSNMGEKEKYLEDAVQTLRKDTDFRAVRTSSWMVTEPYGGVEQDDFLNGAMEVQTLLAPHALLDRLHEIEARAGRERLVHWGPRTLDLDIIFYDEEMINETDLIVPHMDMANRRFVLQPLCELAPAYLHPILNKTVKQMLDELAE